MTSKSDIEWTEMTWNPVAGCAVLSPGCTNCYAMRMAGRLQAMGMEKYQGLTRKTGGRHKWTGKIRLDHESLQAPLRVKKPSLIFVNSMSDLFHDDVPISYIKQVFRIIAATPHCTPQRFLARFCTGATPLIIPTSRYTKHGRHALQTEPVLVFQHKFKSRYF